MINTLQKFIIKYLTEIKIIFVAILILQTGSGAFQTIRYWNSISNYPGEMDFAEGVVLYESNELREGRNIYTVDEEKKFTAAIYGPLLYLINTPLTGIEPDSYRPLRMLSLIAMLIAASACAFLIHSKTGSFLGASIAFLFALISPGVIKFGGMMKPDSLYIALSLVGLALAFRFKNSNLVYLSIPFFVASIFVKPSAMPAPAATFLILFRQDFKKALIFGFGCAILAGLLYGFCSLYFTPNHPLYTYFITNNLTEYDPGRALMLSGMFFSIDLWFLVVAIAAILYARDIDLILYSALCFLFHFPLLGKHGAHVNYWMEPEISLALLIAFAFSRDHIAISTNRLKFAFPVALLLFIVFYRPSQYKYPPADQTIQNERILRDELSSLSQDGRPSLYTTDPGYVVNFRKRIDFPIVDPFQYFQNVKFGRRDGQLFKKSIEEKEFDYILLRVETKSDGEKEYFILSPDQLELIQENYRLQDTLPGTQYIFANIEIYVPR